MMSLAPMVVRASLMRRGSIARLAIMAMGAMKRGSKLPLAASGRQGDGASGRNDNDNDNENDNGTDNDNGQRPFIRFAHS